MSSFPNYININNNRAISIVNIAESYNPSAVDIAFVDSSANAALILKDGHIKTKNFDSQNIETKTAKINSIYNKELSLFGLKTTNSNVETGDLVTLPFSSMDVYPIIPIGWTVNLKLYDRFFAHIGTINLSNETIANTGVARNYKVEILNQTLLEVTNSVNAGSFKILYSEQSDIVSRNSSVEPLIQTSRWARVGRLIYEPKHFTLVHITDVHGDAKRLENAYIYAKSIGANCVVNTGDSVQNSYENGATFIREIDSKYNLLSIVTIGNHDAMRDGYTSIPNETIVNTILTGVYTRNNYTPSASPYYYVDDSEHQIRFIVVHVFEGNATVCNFSQTQVNWLIQTLQNTPAGYGVILCSHSPFADYDEIIGKIKTTHEDVGWDSSDSLKTPMTNLIDAFISRTTTTFLSTEANFTNVPADVEFICVLCGHNHRDAMGYNNAASYRQVVIDSTCGNATLGALGSGNALSEMDNIPRIHKDCVCQDSFATIIINRDEKTVTIVKVGSNVATDIVRDKDTISYINQ